MNFGMVLWNVCHFPYLESFIPESGQSYEEADRRIQKHPKSLGH